MKNILLLLSFLIRLSLPAQEIKIPDNFIETPIPNTQSYDWYKQNYSSESYPIKKGKEELRKRKRRKIRIKS